MCAIPSTELIDFYDIFKLLKTLLEWFKQKTIKLRAVALISNDRFETIAHKQVEMNKVAKYLN